MKKHNGIISLWKFLFCLVVAVHHATMAFSASGGKTKHPLFTLGAIAVEFFFITAGWLMAKKAIENKTEQGEIGKETAKYIFRKVKRFLPYFILAYLIALSVFAAINNYSISEIVSSLWNLSFLQMSGIKFANVLKPAWFISAMLIGMAVLYPLLLKFKKNFAYIGGLILVPLIYGFLFYSYGTVFVIYQHDTGIYAGVLRAIAGLTLGVVSYLWSQRIMGKKWTKAGKRALTLAGILGFLAVVISAMLCKKDFSYLQLPVLFMAITVAFSGQTLGLKKLSNGFVFFLEKLSLPLYLVHYTVAVLIAHIWDLDYKMMLILTMIISVAVSLLVYILAKGLTKLSDRVRLGGLLVKV